MVLPLFSFAPERVPEVGELLRVSGPEAKHAVTVRRMRQGEGIQLSNGSGMRVIGKVSSVAVTEIIVSVEAVHQEARPIPEITLIQAIAKGDRDELAIQAATELGVMSVIPWQADRSISRWEGAKVPKSVERWQTIVAEAAKQALRAYTPSVSAPMNTKQLSAHIADFSLTLVLDPTAETALSAVALASVKSLAVIVGPEGGISPEELSLLENAGAIRVKMGNEILRTSTAGMAAISALQVRLGNW